MLPGAGRSDICSSRNTNLLQRPDPQSVVTHADDVRASDSAVQCCQQRVTGVADAVASVSFPEQVDQISFAEREQAF
jgi:hypothetical protein